MTCLCLHFPFLLVTTIIVLSGLVTMHRVQGQSMSRIHTHQATSLSLVALPCLCRKCKKELQVSSCLDSDIQPQWNLFTGLCGNVSLCCREQLQRLERHWSLKGKEQPTSSPMNKSEPSRLKCGIRTRFCLFFCIKSNSMDVAPNEAFWLNKSVGSILTFQVKWLSLV